MSKIRRINLFGGPGVGKSTIAAGLFYGFKNLISNNIIQMNVEQVQEYVKNWAYEKKSIIGFDQVYTFAKQLHKEEILLRNGVDIIITDSPLLLSAVYSKRYHSPGWEQLFEITKLFEQKYPSLDIVIDRNDKLYCQHGRYQNRSEAEIIDNEIVSFLSEKKKGYCHSSLEEINEHGIEEYSLYLIKAFNLENK